MVHDAWCIAYDMAYFSFLLFLSFYTFFFLFVQLPLSEVITDFFDELKSRSKGYASMSFQDIGYQAENLLR
ncbi:hypothetical protein EON63_16095 [archaeon]|nr:MAG: hypothetical protein EON63_16095 [archaeon]